MSTAVLDTNTADKLAKIAGMFGSDHDNEVLTAARMADALVRSLGLTWNDVIRLPEGSHANHFDWRADLKTCGINSGRLDLREMNFVISMSRWRGEPSPNQKAWLHSIAERLRRTA